MPRIIRLPRMRSDLPSGTVTFLFTDVEGSTKLLHELGAEAYAEALAEHRRVIREACRRHGGVEVDTQGDAFFFAFPDCARRPRGSGSDDRGARGRADPGADGPAHGDAAARPRRATSAATSTAPPASPPRATAARCSSRPRPRSSSRRELARPRRAPAQGPLCARAHLPARRRGRSRRSRGSTRRTSRSRRRRSSAARRSSRRCVGCSPSDAPADADRAPAGRARRGSPLQAAAMRSPTRSRDGVWWVPLAPLRDPSSSSRPRPGARRQGRPRRAHRRPADAPPASTTSSKSSRPRPSRRAARRAART